MSNTESPSSDDTSGPATRKKPFWKRHSFNLSKKTDSEKSKRKSKDKKKSKSDLPQLQETKSAADAAVKQSSETRPTALANTDPKSAPIPVNVIAPSPPSDTDEPGADNPPVVGPIPSSSNATSPKSIRLSFPPSINNSPLVKPVTDTDNAALADEKAKNSPKEYRKLGFMTSLSSRFLSSSFGILSSSNSSSSSDNKLQRTTSTLPRPETAPQARPSRSQADMIGRQTSRDSIRLTGTPNSPDRSSPPPSATDRSTQSTLSKVPTNKRNSRITSNPSLHLSIPQLTRPFSGQLTPTPTGLTPSRTPNSVFVPQTPLEVTETTQVVREMDPQTGNKMINQYMLLRELGRGCHGKVKLGVDIGTGEYWAIKIVDKSTRRRFGARANTPTNLDKVRREIAIMKKCVHPNVVRLKEVIDAPEARKIYLVLEYMDGGEILWKQPERDQPTISIDVARLVFRDVVLGLEYLHFQGIIHRDIKPANLLWTQEKVVKISDFGVSHFSKRIAYQSGSSAGLSGGGGGGGTMAELDRSESNDGIGWEGTSRGLEEDESTNSGMIPVASRMMDRNGDDEDALELAKTAGSPAFFAPELCSTADDVVDPSDPDLQRLGLPTPPQALPPIPPVTKAIDLWALGVTLYCFVYGRCPFMADSEFELFNLIPKVPVTFPADKYLDETVGTTPRTSDPDREEGNRTVCIEPDAKQVETVGNGEEEGVLRNLASMEDRDNQGLGVVDDALKDLMSRLLEKDALKRITLDQVKRHPWVTADLPNPAAWYSATDPCHYMALEVTDAEVKAAVTVMDRIRDQIRKLSISLTNLAKSGMRIRTKSMPSFEPGKDMIKKRKSGKNVTAQSSPVGDVAVKEETGAGNSREEVREEDDKTAAAAPIPQSDRSISGRTLSRPKISPTLAAETSDGTLLVSTLEAEAKRILSNQNSSGTDPTSPTGKSPSTIAGSGNGGTPNPYFPSVAPPRQPLSRNRPASAIAAGSKTALRGGDWDGIPSL